MHINQSDTGLSGGFDALLTHAYAGVSTTAKQGSHALSTGDQLSGGLQSLPQDGKLLPLLNGAVHQLAESGLDPHQIIERLNELAAKLERDGKLQTSDQLVAALQQLIQETPVRHAQPSIQLAMVSGDRALAHGNPAVLADAATESGQKFPGLDARNLLESQSLPLKSAQRQAVEHTMQQALSKDARAALTETALSQMQQQSGALEQRQSDSAVLMAAVKRMVMDFKSATAGSDNTFRSDIATSNPALSAAAAPGNAATAVVSTTSGITMPTLNITTPFGQAGWDQAVGERIQWLVSQKMQGAHVKLNPAHLGPMEVRIHVQNEQASVQFTAHHAVVREALEAALPRLRDMFESSGVELVDVNVSSGESHAKQQQATGDGAKPQDLDGIMAGHEDLDNVVETPLIGREMQGYLDLFA